MTVTTALYSVNGIPVKLLPLFNQTCFEPEVFDVRNACPIHPLLQYATHVHGSLPRIHGSGLLCGHDCANIKSAVVFGTWYAENGLLECKISIGNHFDNKKQMYAPLAFAPGSTNTNLRQILCATLTLSVALLFWVWQKWVHQSVQHHTGQSHPFNFLTFWHSGAQSWAPECPNVKKLKMVG